MHLITPIEAFYIASALLIAWAVISHNPKVHQVNTEEKTAAKVNQMAGLYKDCQSMQRLEHLEHIEDDLLVIIKHTSKNYQAHERTLCRAHSDAWVRIVMNQHDCEQALMPYITSK